MKCRQGDVEDGGAAEADLFKGKEVFYMPGFNGTGPRGEGSMTGRGQGRCNPGSTSNGMGSRIVSGLGRGRNSGQGLGRSSRRGLFGRGFDLVRRGFGTGQRSRTR